MKTLHHCRFMLIFLISCVLTWLFPPLLFGEEAILEATRSEFQKIPIWVMEFSPVQQSHKISEEAHTQVRSILKDDLTRSQVFAVTDLPSAKGDFFENKCVGLSPTLEPHFQKVTVSTWGRLGIGGTADGTEGLIFDACAFDLGHQDVLTGKRYFSLKTKDALVRLMAHRWADELVYRYTGEQGIARTKIAFVGEKDNGRELFVMDYDGYDPQQVTADGYLNLMPTWSPDRKSLIYTAYRDRKQQIMRRELATGREDVLVSPASLNITATFAPDGKSITYAEAKEGNSDIYQIELDSRSTKQLTSHHSADLSPSWSPDGRSILLGGWNDEGATDIFLISAEGGVARNLVPGSASGREAQWSPDGAHIALSSIEWDTGIVSLAVVEPDGSEPRVHQTPGPLRDHRTNRPHHPPSARPFPRGVRAAGASGGVKPIGYADLRRY